MTTTDKDELKRAYQEIIGIVTNAINEWDPYDLIGAGAPDNEFANEIAQIAAKVREINTPVELAEVISKVFSVSFGSELFSVTSCMQIADKLFTELQESDFLVQKNGDA